MARDTEAHEFLAAQFKNRSTRKEYWAIVHPAPADDAGHIENFLARDKNNRKKFSGGATAGKRASTDYKVLLRWALAGRRDYALVALFPKTGRTHQLRVHMAGIGLPNRRRSLSMARRISFSPRRRSCSMPAGSGSPFRGASLRPCSKAPLPERFRAMGAALDRLGRRVGKNSA